MNDGAKPWRGCFDMIAVDDIGSLGHGVQTQEPIVGPKRLIDIRGAAEVRAAAAVERVPSYRDSRWGALLTWLMMPPVEPRPK